jgi:hypothetical protein
MEIKHGLNTYVSKPSSGDGSNKIIFLPDIFGIYPNAKLLADEWAGQGYEVYLPDLFDGSPIDHELLNVGGGGWTLLITLPRPLSLTNGSRSPPRPSPKPPTLSRWAPPWAHGSSPTERPVRPCIYWGRWLLTRILVQKPKIEAFVKAVKEDSTT